MAADAVTVERVAGSDEELALLSAVVARPADDVPRLVYADWLEERGDPRGPLLRRFVRAAQTGKRLPALKGVPPAWADVTGLTWTKHIIKSGLADRRADLLALARPALQLVVEPANFDDPPPTPAALGTTRLGGDPDLQAGSDYPTDSKDFPFYFLGQFDAADLQGTVVGASFPPAGLISVFREPDIGNGVWVIPAHFPRLVRFMPPGTPLARIPRPRMTYMDMPEPERLAPFRPGLRLVETLRLPGCYGEWLDEPVDKDGGDRLDEASPTCLGGEKFLLLGHATHGNTGDEPLKDRPDWVQLILVPHFEGPDYGASDMSLSYHLPAADLKAGRFDRLEATFG